jgi:serine/threonine protein kinase
MTDPDLSGRRLGEFVLQERIGSGGNGTVYRCDQPTLKRRVVVKVLRPREPNEGASARFVREAQLASQLDHPFAAHVYSFGIEGDGVHWIAMELVQGITLGEWLESRGPMSFTQFVPFFEDVAEVVQAAHAHGIVHRDLKPSNIMVIENRGRLFPKLLDFGIAKLHEGPRHSCDEGAEDDVRMPDAVATVRIRATPPLARSGTNTESCAVRLTPRGVVIGSAPYMSPEQWVDPWGVGPATDIYALGCVAYKALIGRTPFRAGNNRSLYELHVRAEPPSLGDGFPSAVDKVLRRALAKSPDARHQSALELAAGLRAALRAEPREQLRSSAQQWDDRARHPGLLWGRDALADVERSVPRSTLSELECSFVVASHRRARHGVWMRRALVALAAASAFVALQYRTNLAEQQTRAERELAAARVTESELEQGRAALLHGEPEALPHLAEAYKRDHSPTTAFMLARAMQPRLSEKVRFASTHGRMWSATFSPDGSQIATSDDRAAQIWDAKTYRLLFTLPHGCEVYQALYTPDGARLVTVAETMVRIWNTRSGALLLDLKAKPGQTPSDFYRAAISPDGRLVAAMDAGGAATRVWDTARGALVAELRNRPADLPALAFSANGWLAMTSGEDARVFDVRTWKQVQSVQGAMSRGLLNLGGGSADQ